MTDVPMYRVRITDPRVDTVTLADEIVEQHGENYDIRLGHFTVEALDPQVVQIVIVDVARGDVQALIDELEQEYGDLNYQVSKREGDGWFSVDLEDDDD